MVLLRQATVGSVHGANLKSVLQWAVKGAVFGHKLLSLPAGFAPPELHPVAADNLKARVALGHLDVRRSAQVDKLEKRIVAIAILDCDGIARAAGRDALHAVLFFASRSLPFIASFPVHFQPKALRGRAELSTGRQVVRINAVVGVGGIVLGVAVQNSFATGHVVASSAVADEFASAIFVVIVAIALEDAGKARNGSIERE